MAGQRVPRTVDPLQDLATIAREQLRAVAEAHQDVRRAVPGADDAAAEPIGLAAPEEPPEGAAGVGPDALVLAALLADPMCSAAPNPAEPLPTHVVKRNYSAKALAAHVDTFKGLWRELGRVPSPADVREHRPLLAQKVKNAHDDYRSIWTAAGVSEAQWQEASRRKRTQYSREEVLAILRDLAAEGQGRIQYENVPKEVRRACGRYFADRNEERRGVRRGQAAVRAALAIGARMEFTPRYARSTAMLGHTYEHFALQVVGTAEPDWQVKPTLWVRLATGEEHPIRPDLRNPQTGDLIDLKLRGTGDSARRSIRDYLPHAPGLEFITAAPPGPDRRIWVEPSHGGEREQRWVRQRQIDAFYESAYANAQRQVTPHAVVRATNDLRYWQEQILSIQGMLQDASTMRPDVMAAVTYSSPESVLREAARLEPHELSDAVLRTKYPRLRANMIRLGFGSGTEEGAVRACLREAGHSLQDIQQAARRRHRATDAELIAVLRRVAEAGHALTARSFGDAARELYGAKTAKNLWRSAMNRSGASVPRLLEQLGLADLEPAGTMGVPGASLVQPAVLERLETARAEGVAGRRARRTQALDVCITAAPDAAAQAAGPIPTADAARARSARRRAGPG